MKKKPACLSCGRKVGLDQILHYGPVLPRSPYCIPCGINAMRDSAQIWETENRRMNQFLVPEFRRRPYRRWSICGKCHGNGCITCNASGKVLLEAAE